MAGQHRRTGLRWDRVCLLAVFGLIVWLLDLDGNLLFSALFDLWRITA